MFQWLKNLFNRPVHVADFEMVAEYPERPPPEPFDGGPRHAFVAVKGKGMAYLGLAASEHEATDLAQAVIGSIVMRTGEVMCARYWTTVDLDQFEERAVVEAKRREKSG